MSYLLDTHILLWWLADDPLLSEKHREIIASGKDPVYVSATSVWEIVIKSALKKLDVPADFPAVLREQDFESLAITADHALEVGALPLHHRDPFDRLLIAQCRVETLTFISQDSIMNRYDVKVLQS